MKYEELVSLFIQSKHYANEYFDVNELLDFCQQNYILRKLSFQEYRSLLQELSSRGANKPLYY